MNASSGAAGISRVALASVAFGFGGVFSRLAYDHGAGIGDALAFRSFALLPLLGVFLLSARRAVVRQAWPHLLGMALLGTLNVTIYFTAVSRMSPALVALIFYIYPALVIAGAWALGWGRLDALTLLAAGAALTGVVLTIGLPQEGVDSLGVALALLNGCGFAAYILLAQRALERVDPFTCVAFVGGLSGLALVAAVSLLGFEPPSGGTGLTSLVLLALVSTLIPHLLLMSGIRRLGSKWSALVTCLEVITTVVATALILHGPLGAGAIAGGALIVLGGVAAPILALRSRPAAPALGEATTEVH